MVSAAEQLAANINFSSLAKAETLKKRLWFTLGVLILYRMGTYIPIPGVDPEALAQIFNQNRSGILGVFDLFAGGALGRMAIFALNVLPYITASIIVQILSSTLPSLEALKKEGERGYVQINQYSRYGSVAIATMQSYGLALLLEGQNVVLQPGMFFRLSTVVTLVGGTVFLMWLGEQVTQRGIGNGVSLIIFAGIVAELPSAIVGTLELSRRGEIGGILLLVLVVMVVVVMTCVVFLERAQRRLLVQYPKRQSGRRMSGGEVSHLPLKLNTAGVIPPIFASSLLLGPLGFANFAASRSEDTSGWLATLAAVMAPGQPLYMTLYAAGIIFFCFFYTSIVFNPNDTADNLKKHGGFIPGIRPGERTAQYLEYVLKRLTTVGALYLTAVCLLPEFIRARYAVPFYFGGTSLLIVVHVTMDTIVQLQGHLLAHQYEGLIKKAKLRGRLR